ncbi:MAG TPA: hypothetical protein VKA62_09280 [Agromyces sp.]|nr:hypothetical protein [Agromyces sp.]
MSGRASEAAATSDPASSPGLFVLLPFAGDGGMVCEGDVCVVPGGDEAATDAAGSPVCA